MVIRTCLGVLLGAGLCGFTPPSPHGLSVRDGVLVKDGRPWRGIGANCFSLFSRVLKDPADTSYRTQLAALAKAGIPFVRFMAGGFWPVEQNLYLEKPEEFFRRLDGVVKAAEENGVGLIPSLFWHVSTVSDLAGEPLDQLGNAGSKSIAHIQRYTRDVVGRYKDSPAIWGWEFGNEYNLPCDLPNASQHRPPCWPQLGTPGERTERDELKFAALRVAFVEFAKAVRDIDKTRLITSGNAMPRPSAHHNVTEKSWTMDTENQFGDILRRDNPDPMDVVSVHQYHDKKGVYVGGSKTIGDSIGLAVRHAAKARKPLFLGEFGVERQLGLREKQEAVFEEFLAAIEKHKVPLAAFWVFDLPSQKDDWNVDFTNDRAWMIEKVARENARMK
jgi:hypothetical protein